MATTGSQRYCLDSDIVQIFLEVIRASAVRSLTQPACVQEASDELLYEVLKFSDSHYLSHLLVDRLLLWDRKIDLCFLNNYSEINSDMKAQFGEWSRIVQHLAQEGVSFAVIKGFDIARYYPSITLRSAGDFDILFRLEEYGELKLALESLGYRKGRFDDRGVLRTMSDVQDQLRWKFGAHADNFSRKSQASEGEDYQVEPHVRVCPPHWPVDLNTEDLLSRSIVRRHNCVEYPALSKYDCFVYLCLHIYRHDTELNSIRGGGNLVLSRLIDLAFILLSSDVDKLNPQELLSHVELTRTTIAVDYCLRQVLTLFPSLVNWDLKLADDSKAIADSRVIRFSDPTLIWESISQWDSDPIDRMLGGSSVADDSAIRLAEERAERMSLIDSEFVNLIEQPDGSIRPVYRSDPQ